MILTYSGYVTRNFNEKIYPLAASFLQKVIVTHLSSTVMDKLIEKAPPLKVREYVKNYTGFFNKDINGYINYICESKIVHKEVNSYIDLRSIKNGGNDLVIEGQLKFSQARLNAPTFVSIERRDPDGYVREIVIGAYIKASYVDMDILNVFLKEEKSKLNSVFSQLRTKFFKNTIVIRSIYRWYDVLIQLLKGKLKRDNFYDTLKAISDYNEISKIVLDDDVFVFISEADILNAWGEEIPFNKYKSLFNKYLGWKNLIIDLPTTKNVLYIGKYSYNGVNVMPYRLLLAEVSDRLRLEDYDTVLTQADKGMRFHISYAQAARLISKSVKR